MQHYNRMCSRFGHEGRCRAWLASSVALWLVSTVLYGPLQVGASSTVNFQLRLHSFSNSFNMLKNGSCCDGSSPRWSVSPPCSAPCKSVLMICVGNYDSESYSRWHAVHTDDVHQCSLAYGSHGPFPSSRIPATNISLPLDSVPNALTYQLVVWNMPGDKPGSAALIAIYYINEATLTPTVWTSRSLTDSPTTHTAVPVLMSISFNYAVLCAPNYYGSRCTQYCVERDDTFGHYTCASDGSSQCLPGWSGSSCSTPVCSAGCDPIRGSCTQPFTCSCQPGWSGENCTQCVTYPGCSADHGYCINPYDCLCKPGWVGARCDQEKSSLFCINNVCSNGGTCRVNSNLNAISASTNAAASQPYVCDCPAGYTGSTCQLLLPNWMQNCSAKQALMCKNGGLCRLNVTRNKDITSTVTCTCPAGYSGQHCEVDETQCLSNPCQNGGNCSVIGSKATCTCSVGFTGLRCQQAITSAPRTSPTLHTTQTFVKLNVTERTTTAAGSGACAFQPCINYQICVFIGHSNFECVCPSPYTGELCNQIDSSALAQESTLATLLTSPAMLVIILAGIVLPCLTIVVISIIISILIKRRRRRGRGRERQEKQEVDSEASEATDGEKAAHEEMEKRGREAEMQVVLNKIHAGSLSTLVGCSHCPRPTSSPAVAMGAPKAYCSLRSCKRRKELLTVRSSVEASTLLRTGPGQEGIERHLSPLQKAKWAELEGARDADESAAYRSMATSRTALKLAMPRENVDLDGVDGTQSPSIQSSVSRSVYSTQPQPPVPHRSESLSTSSHIPVVASKRHVSPTAASLVQVHGPLVSSNRTSFANQSADRIWNEHQRGSGTTDRLTSVSGLSSSVNVDVDVEADVQSAALRDQID